MSHIKVISLDMFQTLVNLDNRFISMWGKILEDQFDEGKAGLLQSMLLEHYFAIATQMRGNGNFLLTKDIYRECFTKLFAIQNINYEDTEAVDILVQEHRQAEFYEETLEFLHYILKKYKVCIVSDTDEDMLPRFYEKYPIYLFTSEKYKSYKNDYTNVLFKEVIQYYDVEPDQIIHIGDTPSDVLGAKRAGIQACWLNRLNKQWEYEVAPDYTIQNLSDLKAIL